MDRSQPPELGFALQALGLELRAPEQLVQWQALVHRLCFGHKADCGAPNTMAASGMGLGGSRRPAIGLGARELDAGRTVRTRTQ